MLANQCHSLHYLYVKLLTKAVLAICLIALLITGCATQPASNSVAANDSIDPRNSDFKRMLDQYTQKLANLSAENDVFFQVSRGDELAVQSVRFERENDDVFYMKLKLVNQLFALKVLGSEYSSTRALYFGVSLTLSSRLKLP